jgi:hypothetical protein
MIGRWLCHLNLHDDKIFLSSGLRQMDRFIRRTCRRCGRVKELSK